MKRIGYLILFATMCVCIYVLELVRYFAAGQVKGMVEPSE